MFASAFEEISAPAKSISAIHYKAEMQLDDLHVREVPILLQKSAMTKALRLVRRVRGLPRY